jgi:hypothetical protein
VAHLGGEDPQFGVRVALGLLAGEQQRLEVGLRAAGGEHAVGGGPEPDAFVGPVDELALDEGAAGRLVPGVEGGVDGGEDRLAEHGGYDHRAVEVREVAGVVEVDGVPEVDVLQLVEHRGRVVQRLVEVDPLDPGREGVDRDACERTVGGGEFGRHPLYSFGHGTAVPLRGRVIEQVRAHGGVLRGTGEKRARE